MFVEWIDARQSDYSDVFSPDEMEDRPLALIQSVGWGIEYEDKIVIAQEYLSKSKTQSEGFRVVATIPKSCVVKIHRLRKR